MFNFAGRRMSGFEVIGGGGGPRSPYPPPPPPMAGTKKKKEPGLNSVKTTLENANTIRAKYLSSSISFMQI